MDRNVNSPKCSRIRKTKYLFHRELCGDRNGLHRPPPITRYCERVSILGLDNGDLRKHIIIGERPTYPYHVVSIRKPAMWTDPELTGLFEPDGYTDGTGGSIDYWQFIRDNEGSPNSSSEIHLEQITGDTPMEPVIDCSDAYLASTFTAWDVRRDHCAQVLYWKDSGIGLGTRSILQVRYGKWNCAVELGRLVALVGACFLGLNCSGGYGEAWGDGAAISAVLPATVYFFEPFGWINRKVPELRYWHTTPETLQGEPVRIGAMVYTPRVSVLKLDIYIRQFLLQKFSAQFGTRQPHVQKMFSNYVGKRGGIRVGRQSDFRITQIAVGVLERFTGSYYFFILALDHTKRLVQPLIARSLSSEDGHSFFSPGSLQHTPSQKMFYEAIKRIMGGVHVDIRFLAHDCSRSCANIPGNMVKCLCRYHSEMITMEEIQMEESGVILEGWKAEA